MRLAGGSLAAFLLLICSSLVGLAQAHELQPSSIELG
jgi:hypothetical protein